jgi:hypothetical protein
MKKLMLLLILILLFSFVATSTVFAAPSSAPVGNCRNGYHRILLPVGVNPNIDRNHDGYVCAPNGTPTTIRYIDNYIRIRCRPGRWIM